MLKSWDRSLLLRLLLFLLIPLMGISARMHQVSQAMQSARSLIASGAHDQAADRLVAAAQQQPGRNDLWEQAGNQALLAGDPQVAIRYFEQAGPFNLSVVGLRNLGDAYEQAGNLSAAITTWQVALSAGDEPAEIHSRLRRARRAQADFSGEIAELQALTASTPPDVEIVYRLGLLLLTREPEAAYAYLEQATQLDPALSAPVDSLLGAIRSARLAEDPAVSLLSGGRALASIGEWGLAAEAFHQASLTRPDYAEAWAYLGEARQHLAAEFSQDGAAQSVSQAALENLQKALSLDPKSLSANLFLALYWQRQNEYDQALQALQTALSLDPKNASLYAEIGNTLALQGNFAEAYQAYLRAIELAPNDTTYLRLVAGFSLEYNYQVRQVALPLSRQAILLSPSEPANLDALAQVLIRLGDLLNAERFLLRAVQANPDYAPAHLHLGLVYLLRGQDEPAYQEINLARSLAAGGATANQADRLLQTHFP